MHALQSKTVAEDAFAELSQLVRKGLGQVDEFTLLRLERAAQKGMKMDPAVAFQALGLVSRLRWDRDQLDRNFNAARAYSSCGIVEFNYASALRSMNRYVEASHWMNAAVDCAPTDLSFLRTAIDVAWAAGLWGECEALGRKLSERAPDGPAPLSEIQRAALKVLRDASVPLETIAALHAATYSFLESKRVRIRTYDIDVDCDPGDESVYVELSLRANYEEVEALYDDLSNIFYETVENPRVDAFIISLKASE